MPDSFVGDFSQVKDRSIYNRKRLPEGEYRAKIIQIEDQPSKAGNQQWIYAISLTEPRGKGRCFPYYCQLGNDQLWKIRNLYAACGITIPKKKMKLQREALKGKELGVVLEDDEYEGKEQSTIAAVIPLDEISSDGAADADDDDEEEEEEAPKASKKDKKDKAGKKAKKSSSDDELEELEIEEL